jgi:hypothetical protein
MPAPSVALGLTGTDKMLTKPSFMHNGFSPCTALDLLPIETFKRDVQWLNICRMLARLSKAGRTMVCSTSCNRALSVSGLVPTARFNHERFTGSGKGRSRLLFVNKKKLGHGRVAGTAYHVVFKMPPTPRAAWMSGL